MAGLQLKSIKTRANFGGEKIDAAYLGQVFDQVGKGLLAY